MRIVFLSYTQSPEYKNPEDWIKRIKPSVELMESLAAKCSVIYAGGIGFTGHYTQNAVEYFFSPPAAKKRRFPRQMHKEIKKLKPDVVIVAGFDFPFQVMQLRWNLGRKVKIIARHHADRPAKGIKKMLQKFADKYYDGYFFTSYGNAEEWLQTGIISNKKKIYEIPAGSTDFFPTNKEESKKITGLREGHHYLWVGRLNENKDPITMLAGFERYLVIDPAAKLHLIYQTDELLSTIKMRLQQSPSLEKAIFLHGYIEHDELRAWYSTADFFVSGSHREACGYALLEAMACGCIPIVTNIPASAKITDNGKYGLLYQPGNADDLFEKLSMSRSIDKKQFSQTIADHFNKKLSSTAIADQLYRICETLVSE